jgi:membrane dipeptidase
MKRITEVPVKRLRARLKAMAGFAALGALAIWTPAQAFLQDQTASVRQMHEKALVLDAHADLPAPYDWGGGKLPPSDAKDLIATSQLVAGGVDAQVIAIFVPQDPRDPSSISAARVEAERKAQAILARVEADPTRLRLAKSAQDIRDAERDGKIAIILSILNAYPLSDDPKSLEAFAKLGVRIVGLTHAGNNDFADSSRPQPRDTPAENNGLSLKGRTLIAEANRLGILVDVSQLSEDASLQAIETSKAPVNASHSGVKGKVNHARNLSDQELDAIAAKGGVIAVNAFNPYLKAVSEEAQAKIKALRAEYGAVNGYEGLSPERRAALGAATSALTPKASVSDLVDSVDYAVARVGIDHVALSSDFNHGGGILGWADASQAANVTAELIKRGYSPTNIGKLWSGNVLRALEADQSQATTKL